jgi:steroid delta-isomerase
MNVQAAFEKYANFLENLTIENIPDLNNFVTNDVLFIDPFHQVKGVENMSEIFIQLFEKVSNITFKIENYATNDVIVYFNWSLSGDLSGKPWDVKGVTRLKFNKKIQIIEHIEYWDAASQFYEKFPIIGPLLRYFRYRISNQ